jgi:hypothetical protein
MNDDYSFNVKFTDEQVKLLHALCKLTGRTGSDVVKMILLGGILMVQVVEEKCIPDLLDTIYKAYIKTN